MLAFGIYSKYGEEQEKMSQSILAIIATFAFVEEKKKKISFLI
jgi:hypothetical protein